MDDITKRYKRNSIFFRVMSILFTVLPIVIFSIYAFQQGEVHEKLVLGCTLIIALILVLINVICKYHIRSTLWIATLGIYMCLDNIAPMLLTMAITTILDEFVLEPLHKHYKQLYVINNQIDRRK